MAIAAFVLGLLGFVVITAILGIVLGALALSRIRTSPQAGKALALWGICLGAGWLLALLLALGLGASVGVSFFAATSGTNVPGSQEIPFTSLATGDCFDFPTSSPGSGVTFVAQTPCNQPHNSQVFATFQASGSSSSYPGVASLRAAAARGCAARANGSLDRAGLTDTMSERSFFPLAGTWLAGQRTISCIIYSPSSVISSLLSH